MAAAPLPIPRDLLAVDLGPGWEDWRHGLSRLAHDLLDEWGLRLDGGPAARATALVLPVRDADGRPAALKLGWPHPEARHEHLALRAWAGRGAVRLLRADPARSALLLERAGRDLAALPAAEACWVVGGLYGLLHRPAPPPLDRLSVLADGWVRRLREVEQHPQVPRRFVVQAVAHLGELAGAATTDGTLVHTDLHYANVLAARRGETGEGEDAWLATDPKPLSGDPAYEVAPLLWNRRDELRSSGGVRDALVERFLAAVDAAGLDEDRARAWVVVRGMVSIASAVEDDARGRPLDAATLTHQTTMVKAMIP